jgi:hypothetical protein
MANGTSVEKQLDLAEKNLDRLLEWVTRFDSKTSVVLGLDTGMLGAIGALAPAARFWDSLMLVFAILTMFFLSMGLLFVFLGNYPRLKSPNDSLFYFGSACRKDLNQYKQEFCKRVPEEHLQDLLEQCHRNSEILDHKFSYLSWAYVVLFASVIPWAVTIILFRSVSSV